MDGNGEVRGCRLLHRASLMISILENTCSEGAGKRGWVYREKGLEIKHGGKVDYDTHALENWMDHL